MTANVFKVDPAAKEADAAARLAIAGGPQAIFLTMLSQAAVPVLTELTQTSFNGALYTFSPVDTSTVTKQLGERAHGLAISQVVPIPNGVRVKVVAEYIDALKALGHGTPSRARRPPRSRAHSKPCTTSTSAATTSATSPRRTPGVFSSRST